MKKQAHGLSAWQLTMLALGTVIGGSFFLGSSVAINAAGPSIIIAFILGGIIVYFTLFALSEMTVANPDVGSFRTFAAQAFGPSAGFVVGWVYWIGMVLAMSSEAAAVSILVREWYPALSVALLGSFVIVGVTLLNLLGADKLSKLESGLAAIKLLALASFILVALLLILGLFANGHGIGAGELAREPFMASGLKGIAGSMLIVIFSYAGFEIIGLAASETDNPAVTVPKAIFRTVVILVGLYVVSMTVLLPLVPTASLSEEFSPMVAALNRWGITWAGSVLNLVLITAILSTMLAAMFGLGRMMRSLAAEGQAPAVLKDRGNVPYRGILFSGATMLTGLGIGLLFPRVYLFLISSGGFALLFTYAVIMATHLRFRKKHGCPPSGKCQMPGYPYSSWIVLVSLILIIISMPLIPGQGTGLVAGLILTAVTSVFAMIVMRSQGLQTNRTASKGRSEKSFPTELSVEFSKELVDDNACQSGRKKVDEE
ncbi:amino acid permease [Dehalobacter sp. DCM]|uniref:amino acid permease n=1 Tax=Dehalobacter sp. DCM TaxID=2907827 RepID=UPI003081D07F|nr:amino acid permease [Dehalobacter sp. DCM]